MIAEILAVGTELLLGQIVDTNSTYISQRLAEIGVDVYHKSCVGDNRERLGRELRECMSRSDLLVITGGLGPTEDDLTKETLAEVLGRRLVLSNDALEDVKAFFARMGRAFPEANAKQAMVLDGCHVIRNQVGTAPGLIVEHDSGVVVALPGVPLEMRWMMDNHVIPYLLRRQTGSASTIRSKVLRIAGMGESAVAEAIADLISAQTNPTIAPYAGDGEVTLRITAKACSASEADSIIRPVESSIRDRLGDVVYGEGDTSLAATVGQLLLERGLTLSAAESCTGGLFAKMITDVPGSSRYFEMSTVTYSNEAKMRILSVPEQVLERHGAVSRETAVHMAMGVARLSGASAGVGITGIAGPGGGTESKPVGLVHIAAVIDDRSSAGRRLSAGRFYFSGSREQIRLRSAMTALNMLRRLISRL